MSLTPDNFDGAFDDLIARGFMKKAGKKNGEVQYELTAKAHELFALQDFVKATDALLIANGRMPARYERGREGN